MPAKPKSTSSIPSPASEWAMEPKLDGWRFALQITPSGEVRAYTRRELRLGHAPSYVMPEIAAALLQAVPRRHRPRLRGRRGGSRQAEHRRPDALVPPAHGWARGLGVRHHAACGRGHPLPGMGSAPATGGSGLQGAAKPRSSGSLPPTRRTSACSTGGWRRVARARCSSAATAPIRCASGRVTG